MARAYSDDLRQRVLSTIEGGLSARQAAARFSIGVATAIVWRRRYRETGEMTARQQGKPRGSKLDAHEGFLLEMIGDGKITFLSRHLLTSNSRFVITDYPPLLRSKSISS